MNYRFIQTSASASDNLYPSDYKNSGNCDPHEATELLIPYSYIVIIITIPFLFPKSINAYVHSFSLKLELRHVLNMFHTSISDKFKDTSRNEILTLSLDTTLRSRA